MSWGSSVSIVSDYGLDDWGWIPGRGKGFSSSLCIETGIVAYPASYQIVSEVHPFPGGKVQPECDNNHSPRSSAVVKNE
jgi:hypothetical protein